MGIKFNPFTGTFDFVGGASGDSVSLWTQINTAPTSPIAGVGKWRYESNRNMIRFKFQLGDPVTKIGGNEIVLFNLPLEIMPYCNSASGDASAAFIQFAIGGQSGTLVNKGTLNIRSSNNTIGAGNVSLTIGLSFDIYFEGTWSLT